MYQLIPDRYVIILIGFDRIDMTFQLISVPNIIKLSEIDLFNVLFYSDISTLSWSNAIQIHHYSLYVLRSVQIFNKTPSDYWELRIHNMRMNRGIHCWGNERYRKSSYTNGISRCMNASIEETWYRNKIHSMIPSYYGTLSFFLKQTRYVYLRIEISPS